MSLYEGKGGERGHGNLYVYLTPKNLVGFGFSYTTRHTYRMQREKSLEQNCTLQDGRERKSRKNKKNSSARDGRQQTTPRQKVKVIPNLQ